MYKESGVLLVKEIGKRIVCLSGAAARTGELWKYRRRGNTHKNNGSMIVKKL